jgi:Ca2+/Na+ antiporter
MQPPLYRAVLLWSFLAGITVILYLLGFYTLGTAWFLHTGVQWSVLIIYFLGMLAACVTRSRQLAGRPSFREMLRTAFFSFAIISLFYYIFYYIFINFIDPSLIAQQKELYINYLRTSGAAQNPQEIQQAEAHDYSVTLGNTIFGFVRSLIGGFGLAIVAALLTRRQ